MHQQNKKQVSQSNTTDMEAIVKTLGAEGIINALGTQAKILMNDPKMVEMLNEKETELEKQHLLMIASIYAFIKANC